MAEVDTKNTLNLNIGGVGYSLPLYVGNEDFYNGKYATIETFNRTLYAPLSPDYSSNTLNAGVEMAGKKYYFLARAYEKDEQFNTTGDAFFKVMGEKESFPRQEVISTTCDIPENGIYEVAFDLNWSVGKRGSHNRDYSLEYLDVVLEVTSSDESIHYVNLSSPLRRHPSFGGSYIPSYPYFPVPLGNVALCNISRVPTQEEMASRLAVMPLNKSLLYLTAGKQVFKLFVTINNCDRYGNAYSPALLVDSLNIQLTFTGYRHMQSISSSTDWSLPKDASSQIKYYLFGAGGGGGGGLTWNYTEGNYDETDYLLGGVGGNGECKILETQVNPLQIYPVTVGGKGIGGKSNNDGLNGLATSAFGKTALGGGGGKKPLRITDGGYVPFVKGEDGVSYNKDVWRVSNIVSLGGQGSLGSISGLDGKEGKVVILYNLKGEI